MDSIHRVRHTPIHFTPLGFFCIDVLSGANAPAYGYSVPSGLPLKIVTYSHKILRLYNAHGNTNPEGVKNNIDTGVSPWQNATIMMKPEGMTQNASTLRLRSGSGISVEPWRAAHLALARLEIIAWQFHLLAGKGESMADTAKIVSCYADIMAIRHPKDGAPYVAARNASVPVINAGDGQHNHPTQTLADLLTISRELGRLSNLTIGLCGDLKYGRTVHSLIEAMSRYEGVKFVLISPAELKLPGFVRYNVLEKLGIPYTEVTSLDDAMGQLDVLYMTRVQRERFDGGIRGVPSGLHREVHRRSLLPKHPDHHFGGPLGRHLQE